jgi:hypothetical protein
VPRTEPWKAPLSRNFCGATVVSEGLGLHTDLAISYALALRLLPRLVRAKHRSGPRSQPP